MQDKRAQGTFTASYEKRAQEALKTWIQKAQQYKQTLAIPPKGADLLWLLSGEKPQIFQQYLSTAPEPDLKALSEDPEKLDAVIGNLQRTVAPSIEGPSEGIAPAPLMSSNIYGFKYDAKSQKLSVKFQGNKGYGQGPIYEYYGVPGYIANMFKMGAVSAKTTGQNKWGRWFKFKNPSLGASHYALIRDIFPYKRIT